MSTAQINQVSYGLTQALISETQPPIVSTRNPTTNDKAQLGTNWINSSSNDAFILTSIVANSATWIGVGGGVGSFTSLTVTPGPISLTGTATINSTGAATTTIGSTSGASGVAVNVGSGNYVLTGAAGSTITEGTGITTGSVAIAGTLTTGTLTLGSTLSSSKTIIQSGTGNIVLASPALALSATGPQILFGAGAPSLTAPQGSLYLNTSGSSTSTRAYINTTGSTTWTAVTTAG
jgi:hypothetical protein